NISYIWLKNVSKSFVRMIILLSFSHQTCRWNSVAPFSGVGEVRPVFEDNFKTGGGLFCNLDGMR
ncbi:MAG: hypothetical protein LBD76_02225, partial [Prevotellaceae bacterium]|nr:hypothetical protein [Prevotellaceae bacterium]